MFFPSVVQFGAWCQTVLTLLAFFFFLNFGAWAVFMSGTEDMRVLCVFSSISRWKGSNMELCAFFSAVVFQVCLLDCCQTVEGSYARFLNMILIELLVRGLFANSCWEGAYVQLFSAF